ncbi:glycosyltransferase 87 family protein [Kutzneria sp. NPDC051319]|uniref:glycosyltransferase family 87 protein n=1 Tax=Kutzneria sp. NPDC051319 TaxID=3155047 RepID=UPI00341CBC28
MRKAGLVLLVLLCGCTLALGYANKARCTGPGYDAEGRTTPSYEVRRYRDVCYSDIQHLWLGRDIDQHVFPYVGGGIDLYGQLTGGAVEYPVLTGLLMRAGAWFADNDGQYLLFSALLLAPFGLLTGFLLGRLARWRALVWALGPPLVLYGFHNWDLPAVACSVAAFFFALRKDRPLVAAALLGLGFAFKFYPAIFVLPLALYVLGRRGSLDAVRVVLTSAVVAVLVNLPFVIAGPDGWAASITFQWIRPVDITSNSIWFWWFRPLSDPGNTVFQSVVGVVSPVLILVSFAVALAVGRRRQEFPLLPVCGAMLCGFLLLYKVDSPQYTLWLLPFLVLLPIRWEWIAAYFAVDVVLYLGVFRWYYEIENRLPDGIYNTVAAQAVVAGVWGRAILLACLFVVFLKTERTSVAVT